MKLEDLIGYQLKDINEDKIIVIKDNKEYIINFIEEEGGCCGFNELNINKSDFNDNPIITNIERQDKSEIDEERIIITFYGKNKELAKIDSISSSGSGWNYGATVSIECKELNINEVISSW